jgi:hypothetical protein
MEVFVFNFNGGNRKVEWVEEDSHVAFLSKIRWWKRKCEAVYCHDATASSFVTKFREVKSLHIFTQLP